MLVVYTTKGILKIQLFSESHPVTVANFISKVKSNIYANKNFYKIISYSNNKLIHNGLNEANDFGQTNIKDVKKFDSIPLEIKIINKAPIYETSLVDPLKIKNLHYKFEKGFICLTKNL